jgi:endonuclease YncB( thermonuclease family)
MFIPVRLGVVAVGVATGFLAEVPISASAADAPTRMEYRVQHSKYGDVGSYTNTVEKNADGTTVNTQGRIKVSILGIPAYRQEFDRVERWKGSRLVNFHGETTQNGKKTVVNGIAEGDHFTVVTPTATTTAPTDVRPANPWSDKLLMGDTILTPEEGHVEKVDVSGGETVPVMVNGHSVETHHYRIQRPDGQKRYELWFDGEGVPIRFADISPKETITFNLSQCEGAAVCPLLKDQTFAQR